MNKQIAFFDIDGTLIDVPNGLLHPTAETVRALTEFQNRGNDIVVATARGTAAGKLEGIEFDGYIFNDGHYIIYHDEVLVEDLFTLADVQLQMKLYEQYHGLYMLVGHETTWCPLADEPLIREHCRMFRGSEDDVAGYQKEFRAEEVEAIACCVLFKDLADLRACYEQIKDLYSVVLYETGLIRMDVYRKGFNKGTACEYLLQKLGIARADSYAFGDGINDKEMLSLVGHGIAMGNGLEELKQIASDITAPVGADGIAKAFKKYFNI